MSVVPCSGRTVLLSLVFIVLFTAVEVWLFRSLDERWFTKAVRLHLGAFIELSLLLTGWYVWRRVTHLVNTKNILTFGGLFRVALFVVISLSLLAILVSLFVQTDPSIFAFLCSVSLGMVIFLCTTLVIADVISFIVRRVICRLVPGKRRSGTTTDNGKSATATMSSSKIELKIRTLLALVFALLLTTFGLVGISRLAVERVHIPVKGLPRQLNGTTVVQISDIHLGPFIGRTRLDSIVEKVNELKGDIVVITGDLVDARVVDLKEVVGPLAHIKSKHGAFYITGKLISLLTIIIIIQGTMVGHSQQLYVHVHEGCSIFA